MQQDIQPSPIRATVEQGVVHYWLDRPAALNALSPALIAALAAGLAAWRDDPVIRSVILQGEGGKAFSAGADVRAMWAHAKAGEYDAINHYFSEEYAIDLMLSRYPKPVLAVVDGICFGGGMGLAVHSPYCVASEFASFAMPETLIGFFPDAGATHFLSRLPGAVGLYLGMTGERITGGDAVQLGLASLYVPRADLPAAIHAFSVDGPEGLRAISVPPPALSFAAHLHEINTCFAAETVEEIMYRLEANSGEWAIKTLATLKQRSPASLRWTIESQKAGRGRDLEACLAYELELVGVSTAHPDFAEGVRAALVDKDKSPRWAS